MVVETTCFASGKTVLSTDGTPVGQYIDQDVTIENNLPSVVASTGPDGFQDETSESTKNLQYL
ncbi:hypothetical protein [Natronosalvus amylolyticus]|uniref:hypothetical protein n=1 Tax=Natronosalvus amylolyticus TaxID=2961994 RepID=UPI0020C950FA|nr:hypothetical protein [Natronosalvus amylolyticus]